MLVLCQHTLRRRLMSIAPGSKLAYVVLLCLLAFATWLGPAHALATQAHADTSPSIAFSGWLSVSAFNESSLPDHIDHLRHNKTVTTEPRGYAPQYQIGLIRVNATETFEGYLHFDSSTLDQVHVYELTPTDKDRTLPATEPQPYSLDKRYAYALDDLTTQIVAHRNPVFPVSINAGETREWVVVAFSDGSLSLDFNVSDEKAFWQQETFNNGIYMLFFGMLVVMVLYHAVLSLVTAYHDYGLYALYVLFILLLQLSLSGHGKYYGLFTSSHWLDNGQMTFAAAACLTGGYFLVRLLDVKALSKALYQISCTIIGLWGLVMLLSFIFSEASLAFLHVPLSCLSFAFVIAVAVQAHRKGNPLAKPFLYAWAALIAGGIVFVLRVAGLLPDNVLTRYGLHIGISVEVILLSMVLAVRIKLVKEDSLKELSSLKNEFLGTISHELRTPINGIIGNADLLLQSELGKRESDQLKDIKESADGIMKVVENILVYSELHAGQLRSVEKPFNIRNLLASLESRYKKQAMEKSITFRFEAYADIPDIVVGDERHLKQILITLLDNAVEYTNEGTVSAFCYSIPDQDDETRFELVLIIQDTGKGIPAQLSHDIFTFFNQADNSYRREHGGLGIGLAICKKLTDLLGGNIRFTSELNKGTTFSIGIPLRLSSGQTDEQEKPRTSGIDHPPKTLVVEDNKVNQKILLAMLKKLGLQSDVASDGKQAVELCREQYYDLIFMDCQMPVMDGFEATRSIRTLDNFDKTIIIAVTANATIGDQENCLASGMNDHIAKPVNLETLKNTMRQHLAFPE